MATNTLGSLASGTYNPYQGPGGATPTMNSDTQIALRTLAGQSNTDDYAPQWTVNGVTFNRNQQGGGWTAASSDNPQLQKLIDAGAIGYGDNGVTVDQDKLNALTPQTAFGGIGSFSSPDVNVDASGTPTIKQEGKAAIGNAANVQWDPNYGWITPQSNVQTKDDFYDKFSGQILPALIASGLVAGGGAAIGAIGGAGAGLGSAAPAFQSAGNALIGGKFNPGSLLSLGSLTGDPGLAQLFSLLSKGYGAVQAAANIKTNPIGSGISLARLAGGP